METVDFFCCGDIINLFSDENFIDDELAKIIRASDYSICNYEGTEILDTNIGMKQKPNTMKILKDAGFDMLLLSNNHIADSGEQGMRQTLNKATDLGFDTIGMNENYEKTYAPLIKEIKGIKFGLLNLCEAQGGQFETKDQKWGYAWIGDPNIDDRITNLRSKVDFVLIFVHAGLEFYRLPLQYYRNLYRHYCDIGADCIICSHPHIPQGVERYNSKLIAYSLGNFYFPRSKTPSSRVLENNSFSLLLSFSKCHIDYTPVYHSVNGLIVQKKYDKRVDLEDLSKLLHDSIYNGLIEQQNVLAFREVVINLLNLSLFGKKPWLYLKMFLYITGLKVFAPQKYKTLIKTNYKVINHVFCNETYRELTKSAVSYILK